jgi:hypothetical protein
MPSRRRVLDLSAPDSSYIGVAAKDDGGVDVGSIVAMVPADSGVEQTAGTVPRLDPDSAGWLRMLAGTGPTREAALARLHEMLVRIARGEVGRRAPRLQLTGPELDDLAHQAAADALIAITGKLGQFRGESRFTTWAYKFRHLRGISQDRAALLAPPGHPAGRRGLGPAAGPLRL